MGDLNIWIFSELVPLSIAARAPINFPSHNLGNCLGSRQINELSLRKKKNNYPNCESDAGVGYDLFMRLLFCRSGAAE